MKLTKIVKLLEKDEIEIADQSTMMNIGRQLAANAAYENRVNNPQEAAKKAANRAYSMILMGIDEYFNRQSEKVVK